VDAVQVHDLLAMVRMWRASGFLQETQQGWDVSTAINLCGAAARGRYGVPAPPRVK